MSSVVARVDGSGRAPVDRGPRAHEECRRREERLESLESFLHAGATESLRARWATELARVHAEHLEHDDEPAALALRRRLFDELDSRRPSTFGPYVRQQALAGARVRTDALRHALDRGALGQAKVELPRALTLGHAAMEDPGGPELLGELLCLAHRLELERGEPASAAEHLDRLRGLAHLYRRSDVQQALASALGTAVRTELERGAPRRGRRELVELRALAMRPRASEDERTTLADALLATHRHAEASERPALERELEALACRPGADQRQRNAWARAVGRAERHGRRSLRRPLELLRERAYRSTDREDLGALFDRLERELPLHEGRLVPLLGVLTEMRSLAERPEADAALRLRFARHWLERGFDSRRYDHGAVANDRCAYAWARRSAERGELEGQVLLGRCLAGGRGIPRDREAAGALWRRAQARGSDEAALLLRTLGVERVPWLRHRYLVLQLLGLALLVVAALTHPMGIDPWGIAAYLGVSAGVVTLTILLDSGLEWLRTHGQATTDHLPAEAPQDDEEPESSYLYDRHVDSFARRPWWLLIVATEDGFALAPLLWLGITPWTAAATGLVFGLAHYPAFSRRWCASKGISYALVALLVLPWAGLGSVIVGHLLWDAVLLGVGARSRDS